MRKCILLAIVALALSFGIGCSWETGARNGVQDGISAAIATLINAPVDAWVTAVFGG